jgi:lipid II:glycine glycyltransferase (peptidoglycan interpeptide bridge formation enzyme)
MEIRILQEADREAFDRFHASHPWGDLLQSWAWGDLKANSAWTPIRIAAFEGSEIIAAASLLKRKLPKVNRCILYASRGPTIDTSNLDLVRAFTEFLLHIGQKEKAILIKIDPPVPIEDTRSDKNLQAVGFRPITGDGFGGTQPKCVMQLDLDKPADALIATFKEKWRYNIRLAERKGVQVDLDAGRDQLGAFYALLKETTERDGFIVRSQRYFEDMWDLLYPRGEIKLAIASFEGQPLSGALCYKFGDKAWYTYGASSNAHRNLMPNHLMQWRLIKWAQDSGCRWYDFRGVSPVKGDGDEHLRGLNRFKEGFSPRFVEYIGEYDLVLSPAWYWLWTTLRPRIQAFAKKRANLSEA